MSTSVRICTKKAIRIDLDRICGEKYYYGVRDGYDIVRRGETDNYLVFFDVMETGRGVEFTLIKNNVVDIRINTPSSTSDLELFFYLIKKVIKKFGADEIICENEVYSTDSLGKIKELVEANMKFGLDLLLHPPTKEDIEIIAVQGPISIDDEERRQFSGGQKEFDYYLDKKQYLPGANEIIIPLIINTDKGSMWCLYLKAGRYIIIPRHARPRNKDMIVDKCIVFYSGKQKKAIDYNNFLKEIDLSKRYDAERSIVKLTKKQLEEIFDKYPNELDGLR